MLLKNFHLFHLTILNLDNFNLELSLQIHVLFIVKITGESIMGLAKYDLDNLI